MFKGVIAVSTENLVIKPKKPKGEDGYKVFSIRIKEDLVSKIDSISEQTGRSRNELIGRFLEYAADQCKVEEKQISTKSSCPRVIDLRAVFRIYFCRGVVFPKYSFVSFATTPDSANNAIKLGMAIKPLKVSARSHATSREVVAPTTIMMTKISW